MRHNPKRAGLLLIAVLAAIALLAWCRHDRTGDVSSSIPASSAASSPITTRAGSGAGAEEPTHAAPPAGAPVGGVAEAPPREAPPPVRADVASTMRGGAVRRATGERKAKRLEAESRKSAPAVVQAQAQGEVQAQAQSSDSTDAGTRAEPAPEAAQPPKETGLLIGRFRNAVGSTFRVTRVSFQMDGAPVAAQDFPNGLEPNADVSIFERRVDVGDHALQVVVEYRGNSGDVFSYFDRYGYKLSSARAFTSTANATTQLTVIGYEKGGVLTSFENRLGVAFRVASTH